ncbi:MAG: amidohydrolase family protein [Gammaproteobacteria bacterium]|nr:amidohydrolase family protein [Gammaproteobacteria bacterium]
MSVDIVDQNNDGVSHHDIAESLYFNTWDDTNKGLYGVYGVKLWVDGSTQGCSGYLENEYAADGLCGGTAGSAGYNYKPVGLGIQNNVVPELQKYWGNKWLIQVHANGDAAMKQTTDAFELLQKEACADGGRHNPNTNPLVIHHATVGGDPKTPENAIRMIGESRNKGFSCGSRGIDKLGKLDITLSHTPAHIAYWGGAFQSILDGKGTRAPDGKIEDDSGGRSTMIDATGSDITYDIPFSLHSDVPVSPVNPLWYVEQVVSRNTWFYPNIDTDDAVTMPVSNVKGFGRQNADRYEALRAITIVPARQNLLGNKIGSIAEEKIADLVILDGDPTDVSTDILSINVISTFVNGIKHCWAAEC